MLGSEEGLNNHRRRIIYEGNSTIMRGDAIHGMDLHRQPKYKADQGVIRDDRQEIRTTREQVEVFEGDCQLIRERTAEAELQARAELEDH